MRYMSFVSAVVFPSLVLAGCQGDEQLTTPGASEGIVLAGHHSAIRYSIQPIESSLGGTVSRASASNAAGLVAGFSNTTGNAARRAVIWRGGAIEDLGTLGGPNSTIAWPGLNQSGMVVGIAQTDEPEPDGQQWSCAPFFTGAAAVGRVCKGFAWDGRRMQPLEPIGGVNSYAAAVNSRGQVAGWAETAVLDPTCTLPQVRQFRAVVWEPRRGSVQELPPVPGDSTSAATAINARGQVAGISGDCGVAVGGVSARHAVLWDGGRVRQLPTLGGEAWHTPTDISASGAIVGFSNPPGGTAANFIARAVLWPRNGGLVDIGLLREDDAFSQAQSINARGQVVGVSCGAGGCRAFLWDGATMHDLNDLADLDAGDVLISARHIGDNGAISGDMLRASSGSTVGFVARPAGRR